MSACGFCTVLFVVDKVSISSAAATFLNLWRFPAHLDVDQTVTILGRRRDHIPILIQGGFLKPLGDPPKNGVKMFGAADVLEKARDSKWLEKAAKHLTRHWHN